MLCCVQVEKNMQIEDRQGLIHVLFERYYTPYLMKTPVRIIVIVIFVAAFVTHTTVMTQVEIGLDQKLSMPEDSYVLKYFQVKGRSATCRCYY